MKKSLINPQRIEWARKRAGLNKVALAELVGVDVRSVTAWESGDTEPSPDNEVQICEALGISSHYLRKNVINAPEPENVSFRAMSKLSSRFRDMAIANATIAFDLDEWISTNYDLVETNIPDLGNMPPTEAAFALRQDWSLGVGPCPNIVHLLEANGVRVFSLAMDTKEVDAFCTWNNTTPFVFLNTFKSSARRRFDAAHELGHLVLHRHGDFQGRIIEQEADAFASSFLMPSAGVNASLSGTPTLNAILKEKNRWGVSVAAFIYRLHKLELMTDWQYRSLFKTISQRGWRTSEPDDLLPEVSAVARVVLEDLRQSAGGLTGLAEELGVNPKFLNDLFFGLAITSIGGSEQRETTPTGKLKLVWDAEKRI